MIISHTFIWHSLTVDTNANMDKIINKTCFRHFYILYNNMNFYKNICNQKQYNQNTRINYIVKYIYLIKILKKDNCDKIRIEQYINFNQINQKLVNKVINKDIGLRKANFSYKRVINKYIITKIFGQYFSILIYK